MAASNSNININTTSDQSQTFQKILIFLNTKADDHGLKNKLGERFNEVLSLLQQPQTNDEEGAKTLLGMLNAQIKKYKQTFTVINKEKANIKNEYAQYLRELTAILQSDPKDLAVGFNLLKKQLKETQYFGAASVADKVQGYKKNP